MPAHSVQGVEQQGMEGVEQRKQQSLASSPVHVDVAGMPMVVYENDRGQCGYATRLWDCSVGLARWMAESLLLDEQRSAAACTNASAGTEGNAASHGGPELGKNALMGWRVLEVGAGTGLCSLALLAASPHAESITASDIDPNALPLIEAAAELLYASERLCEIFRTGRGRKLKALIVDVCSDEPLPECDLLICCDSCYTTDLATALARRCAETLERSQTAKVLIADPGRPHRETLLRALSELGIQAKFEDLSGLEETDGEHGDGGAAAAAAATGARQSSVVPFAEWLRGGAAVRVRLLSIEDDARLFGLSCMPAMY